MSSIVNQICSHYTGRTILLTGGSGYIASGILRLLNSVDCTIIRLIRRKDSNVIVNSVARIKDVYGDITEKNIWNDLLDGVDTVFHLAAQTSAYAANQGPVTDAAINVFPIVHILETCRLRNLHPTILFAGTVTESGIPADLPVNEMHPDNPVTIYDLHKLMAEQYVEYYARCCKVKGSVLRLSNVYGPGPIIRGDRGVLNAMVRKALKGEILSIYGHGNFLRDYIYIDDVSNAFLTAAARIDHLDGGHYVIGSGTGYYFSDVIRMVADQVLMRTGRNISVINCEPPESQSPIELRNFVADSSKFRSATGWSSGVTLKDGINRTIDCFLNNSLPIGEPVHDSGKRSEFTQP